MSLDRSAILAASDLKVEPIDLPEWGGSAFIRMITGAERDGLEAEITGNKGKAPPNFSGRFASMILCDERGARLFTDADAKSLGAKSSMVLTKIVKAGIKFNGLSKEEASTLLGESEAAPSGEPGSVSP